MGGKSKPVRPPVLSDCVVKLHESVCVFLQLSVCKELQLPSSEYNYTADLVAVASAAPLETAAVQSISVLAVAAEGTARLWPSLAQEGNYTETDVDLGDLCNFVVAVRVSKSLINLVYFDAFEAKNSNLAADRKLVTETNRKTA